MNSTYEDLMAGAEQSGDVEIDLSEIGDDFTPVPKGRYTAQCVSCERGLAKTSGGPVLKWAFRILEGDYTAKKVYATTPISGKGAVFAVRFIKGLGFSADPDNGKLNFNAVSALGRVALLDVEIDPKNAGQNKIMAISLP